MSQGTHAPRQSERCQDTCSIAPLVSQRCLSISIALLSKWRLTNKGHGFKLILLCFWHFCVAWSWRHRKVTAKRLAGVNRDLGDCFVVLASKVTLACATSLFSIFQDWRQTPGAKGKAGRRTCWLCYWSHWASAWHGRWWNGPQLCQSEPLSGALHISKCL